MLNAIYFLVIAINELERVLIFNIHAGFAYNEAFDSRLYRQSGALVEVKINVLVLRASHPDTYRVLAIHFFFTDGRQGVVISFEVDEPVGQRQGMKNTPVL